MESIDKALPAGEGSAKPAQIPAAKPKKVYEPLPKGRLLLAGTALFCLLLTYALNWPWGLGNTLTIFAWYLLLLPAVGREALLRRRECRVLLVVILALAASFALTSNPYFRWWNFLALLALAPIHAVSLSRAEGLLPWWDAGMLKERWGLLFGGLFGHIPAVFSVPQRREKRDGRKTLPLVLGACGAVALVSVLIPILASADALFAAALGDLRWFSLVHFSADLVHLFWTCLLTPFLFGFLYSLLRPREKTSGGKKPLPLADASLFLLILAALAVLYFAFLAVQSAGLFGGPEYLESRGLSYAEWARSGFFQMVGVTAVNLSVILAALVFSRQEGQGWSALRVLAALLSGESLVLLASAAWRMSLYVAAYGLSFKRFLTYWGMVMMALFFLAALWKTRKPGFGFWRAAFPLALAGWLVINCVPVDYLVAKDQVDRYLEGNSPSVSIHYLLYSLSYDTISQLERLDGSKSAGLYESGWWGEGDAALEEVLARRRQSAQAECRDWRSWSLSACLAAFGGE